MEGLFIKKSNLNDHLDNDFLKTYNNYFRSYGWVTRELLSVKLMQECIYLAREGKFEQAEEKLINYLDDEYLDINIERYCVRIKEFNLRKTFLLKAFEDYKAERYHACVPILLMMFDGILNDINPEQKSGEDAILTAWNSVSGNENSFGYLLKEILYVNRKKTTIEEISLPYRNGILHGRDLGFATKKVAAKCWHALFVLGDLASAIKSEEWRKKDYYEPWFFQKSDRELIKRYTQSVYLNKLWEPRIFEKEGFPIIIDENTFFEVSQPEYVFYLFVMNWKKRNYGKLASLIFPKNFKAINHLAGEIRKQLNNKELISVKITNIIDEAPAYTVINVDFIISIGNQEIELFNNSISILSIYNSNYICRGCDDAEWLIVKEFLCVLNM